MIPAMRATLLAVAVLGLGGCFVEVNAGYYSADTADTLDGYGIGIAAGVFYDHQQALRASLEAGATILPGSLASGGNYQLWNESLYGQLDYQFAHWRGDRTLALSGGLGRGNSIYKVRPEGTAEDSIDAGDSYQGFAGFTLTLPFAPAPHWAYEIGGGIHAIHATAPAGMEDMNALGASMRVRLTWSPFVYQRPLPAAVDPTEAPLK
jgi:hypothetical protein